MYLIDIFCIFLAFSRFFYTYIDMGIFFLIFLLEPTSFSLCYLCKRLNEIALN
ncbi:hypothetical protein S101189_00511 [Pediococcus acidilactici]|nr:hypothetical protein S100424_00511 [Pediococcus acidilactici]ARW25993.1 hypothetical protein S100313_00529 [Pediococcus acidilactici]ARW28094.1 hypothetical protein S101189_00511 [Pediococcus acidilactici]OBR27194.1 hypothetical protein SRCM100320_01379 [Pediococcus acidilactici]QHM54272.1 hypothetical protein C7M42_00984 [Pediococcus acidilactici]